MSLPCIMNIHMHCKAFETTQDSTRRVDQDRGATSVQKAVAERTKPTHTSIYHALPYQCHLLPYTSLYQQLSRTRVFDGNTVSSKTVQFSRVRVVKVVVVVVEVAVVVMTVIVINDDSIF